MKELAGIFLFCCCYVSSVWSTEVTGIIIDTDGKGIGGVTINDGNSSYQSSTNGHFSFNSEQRLIQLTFSKKNYYPSVHTFSASEISALGTSVTLVKKQQGRTLFAFGGDVMMGRRYHKPYFDDPILLNAKSMQQDTKTLVKQMRHYMQHADYAVVNLETQIADVAPTQKASKSVTFISPPETLEALSWAGVDYVTLGNNHTFDYLDSGLASTINFLNQSKLAYSGAGIDQNNALAPHNVTLSDHQYAMLGYVGWEGSARPSQIAGKDKGGAAWGSLDNIVGSVSQSVAKGHFPIVQYHGSLEYSDEPTGVTEQRLKAAIDAGAVMAIAHHPHVAQGFEIYKGKLIAYSMGNFIFDQYFSSTHHSYVLLVWMDGDQFYRAEVVPIYLKGYQPTPAVAFNRYSTLKRLSTLSKQRQLNLSVSGGHGVIQAKPASQTPLKSIAVTVSNQRVKALDKLPWQATIGRVKFEQPIAYRLGLSLTNGGDFEQWNDFDSAERGWLVGKQQYEVKQIDANTVLALSKEDEASWFGMQNFRRVFKPDSPSSVRFRIKSDDPLQIKLYWQGRKTRQRFFDALNSADKNLISQIEHQGNDWQEYVVDFNSPRIGYRSYRVLFELNGGEQTVLIDDVNLIEWQSAYTRESLPPRMNTNALQASFIGFKSPTKQKVEIEVEL